jgi:hypothetical protein
MASPRFVLRLRTLMLGVLVFGLLLGGIAYWIALERQGAEAQVLLSQQYQVTDGIMKSAQAEVRVHAQGSGRAFASEQGTSSSHASGWSRKLRLTYNVGPERHVMVDLDLRGSFEDNRLGPIVIQVLGGEFNAKVLERLGQAYRKEGWPYRIVSDKVAPTTSE